MKVQFEKGWNQLDAKLNLPNHESSYSKEQVAQLIGQVRNLEGIKDKNYAGVPSTIKVFATNNLWGENIISVVKGIHQRWGDRSNPHPHIRVRSSHTMGPSAMPVWVDFHVELSEEFTSIPSRHSRSGKGDVACCWQAVGISYVTYGPDGKINKNSIVQRWPAQFSQSVEWIQDAPRGRKRTLSVGCRPAPMGFQTRDA